MKVFSKKINTFLVIFLLFVFTTKPSTSANKRITWPEIISSVKYFEEISKLSVDSIISGKVNFQPYAGDQLKRKKIYWLKIIINNSIASEKEYFINLGIFISSATLYQYDENNELIVKTGGCQIPERKRSVGGIGKNKLPFITTGNDETVLFIRFYTELEQNYNISLSIIPRTELQEKAESLYIIQFSFIGIIVIILILNLTLFVFTRDKLYLFYFSYVFATLLYFLHYSQISERYILYNFPKIDLSLYYSLLFAQALYIWFFITLLKFEKVKVWRRYLRSYGLVISIWCIVIYVLSYFNRPFANWMNHAYSIINALLAIALFLALFKKVSKKTKIILSGTFILALTGFISTLAYFLNYAPLVVNLYQAGFFVELILFTVAVNYFYYNERIEKEKILAVHSQVVAEKSEKEKEVKQLNEELSEKERDLATKTFLISQKETIISEVTENLINLCEQKSINSNDIIRIIRSLQVSNKNEAWDEFELLFKKIHPGFYTELLSRCPGLTKSDVKLCAFIKLNFTTKQIAAVTGKTTNSIDVARNRLRNKLGVKNGNLISEIAALGN